MMINQNMIAYLVHLEYYDKQGTYAPGSAFNIGGIPCVSLNIETTSVLIMVQCHRQTSHIFRINFKKYQSEFVGVHAA